jgi:hypothetical protein
MRSLYVISYKDSELYTWYVVRADYALPDGQDIIHLIHPVSNAATSQSG